MVQTQEIETEILGNPQVRICDIVKSSGSCGFNLTKSKWDPYPWVSNVECGSPAEIAGVQAGDCLLEVNGEDVLGLRVVEVANRVKAREERVTVMLWNSGADSKCTPETICCGPMPSNLQRLSTCMNNILAALECPICLETISPPAHQCANGHLICLKCRMKTDKCPVCRLKLFRGRSLLADQVYNSLIDAFDLRDKEESRRRKLLKEKLLGQKSNASKNKVNLLAVPANKLFSRLLKSSKFSSAENLTESNSLEKNSNLLNPLDEFNLGLKAKSLSSNEIFKFDNQSVSRTTSVLSNRPGSGLLDIQPLIFSKRPASYHGSVEELVKSSFTDFGHEVSAFSVNYCCPCDSNCQEKINTVSLMKHIQNFHEGPILHFFKPQIELSFPLANEKTTVMITCYNTVFIVKILKNTYKNEENILWVWSLYSKEDFTVQVTYSDNETFITSETPVISFETSGWEHINNKNFATFCKFTNEPKTLKLNIISKSYL